MSSKSEFFIQHSIISSRLSKRLDGQLNMHGISFTEYMIMHFLNSATLNTMRRIEIAEAVGISASGVTWLIAPMEKTGIVEKEANPRDARQSLVKLSTSGKRLFKEASISFEACSESLLERLSQNQLDKLIDLTGKL